MREGWSYPSLERISYSEKNEFQKVFCLILIELEVELYWRKIRPGGEGLARRRLGVNFLRFWGMSFVDSL